MTDRASWLEGRLMSLRRLRHWAGTHQPDNTALLDRIDQQTTLAENDLRALDGDGWRPSDEDIEQIARSLYRQRWNGNQDMSEGMLRIYLEWAEQAVAAIRALDGTP